MAPTETLPVTAFDAKNADFMVLGHPELRFAGETEARHAGCIVMPQAPRVGEIQGASGTESIPLRAPRPRVISMVPGTVQRPAPHKEREADAPRELPRTWRR